MAYKSDLSLIRAMVDERARAQRARVQYTNRISAIERGDDSADERTLDLLNKYAERHRTDEEEATKDIADMVQGVEIIERMTKVKGIGITLAATIASMIDISKDDHVSNLWRYAGYAVAEDGRRERPTKGEKLHYNVRLKTALYLAAVSMIRLGSPYRVVYDEAKAYYQANRPEWTKAHIHQASLRKMVKIFLQHLWLVWRTIEGLPVTQPYVQENLGHNHIYAPQQFGWEDFGQG